LNHAFWSTEGTKRVLIPISCSNVFYFDALLLYLVIVPHHANRLQLKPKNFENCQVALKWKALRI